MTALSTDGPRLSRMPPAPGRNASRRLSPRLRKLVLSLHVITGVGLLGVDLAMVGLAAAAAATGDPSLATAAYTAMGLLTRPLLPALAIGALVTGVVLSVGTKWGLFRHYWIVTKLVLTIVVILLGANLVSTLIEQAHVEAARVVQRPGTAGLLLVLVAGANLAMLLAATVISVYKPWGPRSRLRREVQTVGPGSGSSSTV